MARMFLASDFLVYYHCRMFFCTARSSVWLYFYQHRLSTHILLANWGQKTSMAVIFLQQCSFSEDNLMRFRTYFTHHGNIVVYSVVSVETYLYYNLLEEFCVSCVLMNWGQTTLMMVYNVVCSFLVDIMCFRTYFTSHWHISNVIILFSN